MRTFQAVWIDGNGDSHLFKRKTEREYSYATIGYRVLTEHVLDDRLAAARRELNSHRKDLEAKDLDPGQWVGVDRALENKLIDALACAPGEIEINKSVSWSRSLELALRRRSHFKSQGLKAVVIEAKEKA